MQNKLDKTRAFFIKAWDLLLNVGFLLIIFLVAFFLFYKSDQAQDFIKAFVQEPNLYYEISVAILLFFWSYITWYSASVILEISKINLKFIQTEFYEKFCLLLSLVPSFILAGSLFVGKAWLHGIAALGIGLFSFFIFKWLNKKNNNRGLWPTWNAILKHNTNDKGEERTPLFIEEIKFILHYYNVRFYFVYIGAFFLVVLLLFCFPFTTIKLGRLLHPASVVILALTFFTYIFTVIFYLHDFRKRPFIIYIFIWLIFCSYLNDNSELKGLREFKGLKDYRLTPPIAFDKWYEYKSAQWKTKHDSLVTMPVIFIATQGGGIRGEIWTSEVLQSIEKTFPGFYDQVFCIGGASGGTVGALYYNLFMYDLKKNAPGNPKINFSNFQKFTSADCLSPVTASFAFGETIQKILPFPVASLDRSKIMMKAFSNSYNLNLSSHLADSSLLDIYYPNKDASFFNCDIPSIFVNGTLAETGQQVITSNLNISQSKNFEHDIDFFDKVRADISVSTASLNCMRFPFLFSGGLINKRIDITHTHKIGHIVDGGYRDNSGLQAMQSLITDLILNFKDKNVKPILIYLRNGGLEYESAKENEQKAITGFHDMLTPFSALFNINGTATPSLISIKMIEQLQKNYNISKLYYNQIWLKDTSIENEKFPLGLYISDTSCQKMRRRASNISTVNKGTFDTLSSFFNPIRKD
ncbi:MAG: patatin-like phospholipase family protein [Ferruginibacter sp.]